MSGRTEHGLWGFAGAIIAAFIGAYATLTASRKDPEPPPGPPPAEPAATATIDNVWLEHDVYEGGERGVRVRARVTTRGRKGVQESVAAYFYNSGEPLRDRNGRYRSGDGLVSARSSFVAERDEPSSHELAMFLPASELELGPGRYDLTARVQVYDHGLDRTVATAAPVSFTFTNGDPAPPAAAGAPSATIQRVWIEHNVVFMGLPGMRIHVAFTASNLLGAPLAVSAGFSDANGNLLRDFNGLFRFPDGTAGVGSTAVPNYPVAVFNDYVLFMPYNELHMNPGHHSLQARVGIAQAGSTTFLAVSDPVPFDFRT